MAKLTSKSKKPAQVGKKNGKAKNTKAKIVDLEDDVTDQEEEEDEDIENGTNGTNGKHREDDENTEPKGNSSASSLLADCEKYFGSRDLYSILNVDKVKAKEAEIKKAYYKLSLKYHPDKADDTKREGSTIKFQVLSKIYSILSDAEKKKLYDEQGIVDDESGGFDTKDWNEYWRTLFKKVTKADFEKFFAEYRDSAEERADLLRIYEKHEGDMGEILDEMFTSDRVADEPRFRKIIDEAIEKDEAKSYKKFSGETKQKAARRKAAYEKEAREAEEEMVKQGMDGSEESLKQIIQARQQKRGDDFLSKLEQKYGGKGNSKKNGAKKSAIREDQEEEEDDEDEDDEDYGSKPKKAKRASKATKPVATKAPAAKKVKRL